MHERLMHAGKKAVISACEQAGIPINKKEAKEHHCVDCQINKAIDIISRQSPPEVIEPFARV